MILVKDIYDIPKSLKMVTSYRFSSDRWQILDEYRESINSDIHERVHSWLVSTLDVLDLPGELQNRIVSSAQGITIRLLQMEPMMKLAHIHYVVFVRQLSALRADSWGFFIMERVATSTAGSSPPDHSVEFYLFPDSGS